MGFDTIQALKEPFVLRDVFASVRYKLEFIKEHPDWFYPDGILVFTGPQGSGKTLSGVAYVKRLLDEYPKAILCSNVDIDGYEDRFIVFDSVKKFKTVQNGEYGVIYFIDEIQLLFNSLESKNLDLNLFTTICQQRKQRKHIVGTAQVFHRISKGFREQFKYAVMCVNFFGIIQYNKIVKGEDCVVDDSGTVTTKHVRRAFFAHSPALYNSYDTYATIDRTNFDFDWSFVTFDEDDKGGKKDVSNGSGSICIASYTGV